MKNSELKGSLFIALGACCYGMLGTYVKMAYRDGFNTAEVTISQFGLGFIGLLILTFLRKRRQVGSAKVSDTKSLIKLTVAGMSLGLTSIFYYMAVKYIAVSIGIVLLAQTVWMSVVLEAMMHKKSPGMRKILSVVIIMTGTILATNLLKQSVSINWTGFAFGLMAALCYTATMYSSNNLEIHFPPLKRSLYMVLGGLIIIVLVFHSSINQHFSYRIFLRWGPVVSLFGTILPPLLFTRGMPLAGMGIGAIVASIEIPIAVIMANLLLNEPVDVGQWIGVVFILLAVTLMNTRKK